MGAESSRPSSPDGSSVGPPRYATAARDRQCKDPTSPDAFVEDALAAEIDYVSQQMSANRRAAACILAQKQMFDFMLFLARSWGCAAKCRHFARWHDSSLLRMPSSAVQAHLADAHILQHTLIEHCVVCSALHLLPTNVDGQCRSEGMRVDLENPVSAWPGDLSGRSSTSKPFSCRQGKCAFRSQSAPARSDYSPVLVGTNRRARSASPVPRTASRGSSKATNGHGPLDSVGQPDGKSDGTDSDELRCLSEYLHMAKSGYETVREEFIYLEDLRSFLESQVSAVQSHQEHSLQEAWDHAWKAEVDARDAMVQSDDSLSASPVTGSMSRQQLPAPSRSREQWPSLDSNTSVLSTTSSRHANQSEAVRNFFDSPERPMSPKTSLNQATLLRQNALEGNSSKALLKPTPKMPPIHDFPRPPSQDDIRQSIGFLPSPRPHYQR